jgi:predicted transposase YbfD/YdcC
MTDLITHFSEIPDPRKARGKRHKLIDIIVIAICGIICGADNWVMIEAFGKAREKWFGRFLELPHGIPSHDTFGNVFAMIKPQAFQNSFIAWIKDIAKLTQGQVIAIDGKRIRRSHNKAKGQEAIHLVSAWASENELAIGQVKADGKSNEITAIPILLKMLDITGCIVSIDAIGTQKKIVSSILDGKGDYLLAVKGNQPGLYDRVEQAFRYDQKQDFDHAPYDYGETINKNHGRIEKRQCWVVTDPDYINYIDPDNEWAKLNSLIILKATRIIDQETTSQIRYFISSLKESAQKMMGYVRQHWGVENKLHWSLDMTFREDDSRVRSGHAPENLALMRKMALNLLRQNKSRKGSVKTKRLLCATDPDFLLDMLNI